MSRGERQVKVTVLGEDKGAARALRGVEDAAARLSPTSKSASGAIDNLTTRLTSGLGPASGQAKAALDKIGMSAVASGGMLQTAMVGGAAIAGLALAKFAMDGINNLVSLAGEVRAFGQATGMAAEESSRMIAIADDLGISSETLSGALFKLQRNTADGTLAIKGAVAGWTEVEVSTASVKDTLLDVIDAYANAPDQVTKAQIAFAAFGKQGQDSRPHPREGPGRRRGTAGRREQGRGSQPEAG